MTMKDLRVLAKQGKDRVHNINNANKRLKYIVDALLEDEYSKVPLDIKMELKAIEKEIRENL